MRELAHAALETARLRGAEYADVRLVRRRRQNLAAEDERLAGVTDSDDFGVGARVLVDGAWGFAGSGDVTREGVQKAAAQAVDIARASASAMRAKVRLAPEPPASMTFVTECRIDPFAVAVGEKSALLLAINERLKRNSGIRKAEAFMSLRRDERLFVNSDGADLRSNVVTTAAGYRATAVGEGDARSRSYMPPPLTRGYENINGDDLLSNTDRVAAQACEHLRAPDCPVGIRDLILDPQNLSLTIHESVGHATELDRALGYEESLAGRSFATPDKLRNLAYGSERVTFVADNTLPGGLATHGFDDDGVPGQRWHMVENGLFVGYSTGREVATEIGLDRSNGGCRADHWGSIPIVRIPNLSLMPGKGPLSLEELIADTDDGIYIEGRGSFSIDQMRCNFQFGGDAFWEIRGGKIVGMLKNVTYQSMTTDFWGSCDAVCDERFWVMDGVLNCGKGDPMQIAQMTHGAAPARFRGIKVGAAR